MKILGASTRINLLPETILNVDDKSMISDRNFIVVQKKAHIVKPIHSSHRSKIENTRMLVILVIFGSNVTDNHVVTFRITKAK